MQVRIDEARCAGHGRCYAVAPQSFDYDDDGFGTVRDRVIPAERQEEVRRAASACPESAVTIAG
jgi:ferredoxin